MQSSLKDLVPSVVTNPDSLQLKVGDGESQEFSFNEGTAVVFIVSQNIKRDVSTPLELTIEPLAGSMISEAFSQTFPIKAAIQVGQLNATLSLSTLHDLRFSGERKFKVILSSPQDQISTDFILKLTDLEAPPEVNFSLTSQVTTESTATSSVAVLLNRVSTQTTVVPFTFVDNTAVNSVHYTATGGQLTFAPGEISKNISWAQVDNLDSNATREFSISLQNSTELFSVGTLDTHQVQITDDESPTISISDVNVDQGSAAQVTVTLNPVSHQAVTVNYQTVSQTATAGTHFVASTGTLSFAAGESSKTISLSTNNISTEACGPDRAFEIQLSSTNNATIGVSSAIITIIDPKTPTINLADGSGLENAKTQLTVSLDKACTSRNVTFTFATSNGTAMVGTDYQSISANGSITAGQTLAIIEITNIDDSTYQGDRNFTVTLSNLQNAQAGALVATGTVQDNESPMGTFSISGITSDSESTQDANLSNGVHPIVTWSASTNANSYDVSVLADDGTTGICASQNTNLTQYDFSSCALSEGLYYKAKVVAKAGADVLEASNSLFRFYVNRSPTLGSGGNGIWFIRAGNTLTINALWAASPVVGVASDADGDVLSFTSVGSVSLGTLTNNGSSLSYAPSSTSFGKEQITYTISDSRGGTMTGTLTVHVMQAYTWTGAVSSSFSTAGNWCGSISSDFRSCAGSSTTPFGGSSSIYLDNTCASVYTCSPTTNVNLALANLTIASGAGLTIGTGFTLSSTAIVKVDGGSLIGSNGAHTFNVLNVVNGTYKATSSTTKVGSITIGASVSFDHNSGLIEMVGTGSSNLNGHHIHNLNMANTVTSIQHNFTGDVYVDGNLTRTSNAVGSSNGTFIVKGDVTSVGRIYPYTISKLIMVGSSSTISLDQSFRINDLEINGGTTVAPGSTLYIAGSMNKVSGSLNLASTRVLWVGTTTTMNLGNQIFDALEIYNTNASGIKTITGNIIVNSELVLRGPSYSPAINGGEIQLYGNLILDGYAFSGGTTKVRMLGGAIGSPVTITGGTGSYVGNLEIESAGDVKFLSGEIIISSSFKYISGNVDTSSSNVTFKGGMTIEAGPVEFNDVKISLSNTGNATVVGSLVVNGNFIMAASYLPKINGGPIYVRGNLSHTGSVSGGSSEIILDGAGDQTISKGTASYHFPGTQLTINKTTGNVLLASNVTLASTQTLSITSVGYFDMNAFDLNVKALSLNSTTLYKRTGALTVNGASVTATGPLYGGTILDN